MARATSLILLAVLTMTAGCLGIAADATSTAPTAEPTTSAQPTPTANGDGTTDAVADRQRLLGTPASPDVGTAGYQGLYRATIDSVVKLKVITTGGSSSIGSGFVYDAQGRIVTNQHVIADAATVMVRFRNGEWRVGEVVGSDVYTDLAVVDVDDVPGFAEPLPITERNVHPGEFVVALGSPFGLEGSITHGMISGVNRSMGTNLGFSIPDTIQTDAPINPGNSGGPLVSLNGTVVGVNRAKQGDNVGFAISADVLQRVVRRLIHTGSFDYPYLGVRTTTVTPVIASASDLSTISGVMVTRHLPRSPAEGTLRAAEQGYIDIGRPVPVNGDVIRAIDGRAIHTSQELARYLLLHTRPGDTVQLKIVRDGVTKTVSVELGSRPEKGAPT